MSQPKLAKSALDEIGVQDYKLKIDANFKAEGTKLSDYFVQNDMSSDLDKTGNDGADFRRWSVHYNPDNFDDVAKVVPGEGLVMRFKHVKEADPGRAPYTMPDGTEIKWNENKVYGPWLDSMQQTRWINDKAMPGGGGKINDENSPMIVIGPNTYTEIKVNFENSKTRGGRSSFWLMPWQEETGEWVGNKAYTKDVRIGSEIDLWEVDPANPDVIMMKVVGGKKGDTPNGMVNFRKKFGPDYDLFKGDHLIGLYWQVDERGSVLHFTLDGYIMNTDRDRVPETLARAVLSFEGNSGVKKAENIKPEDKDRYKAAEEPLIPEDPGLFPPANLYNDIDKMAEHKVVVRRWRSWSFYDGIIRTPKLHDIMEGKAIESASATTVKENKKRPSKTKNECPACGHKW